MRAYTNLCAVNEHSVYPLLSFQRPISVQISDRAVLEAIGTSYFADFAVPRRPIWVVETEYGTAADEEGVSLLLGDYTCDYSLHSIVTGAAPAYLNVVMSSQDTSGEQQHMIRFSRDPTSWPSEIFHDKVELRCLVAAGADFTAKSTFEILFYEFDYEATQGLPEEEQCFHVANMVAENPRYEPVIIEQWRHYSYWYQSGTLLLQCCLINDRAVTTLNGVLLLPHETYSLED